MSDLPFTGPFALLGAILLALGAYAKGFKDGSSLADSRLQEIKRLGEKMDAMETKLTAMNTKLDDAHEENFNLKVMFNAIKEKNEELIHRLERYEGNTEETI